MKEIHSDLIQILKDEVKPALGCTEPVALGLAVARAYTEIGGELINIDIQVSSNIYKNGMGVGIPGTSQKGLIFATALGAACGDPSLGFEVFRNVNDENVEKAEQIIEKDIIKLDVEDEKGNFYIEVEVLTDKGKGLCVIKDSHINIVLVKRNDEIVFEKQEENTGVTVRPSERLKDLDLADFRSFVEDVEFKEIEFLLEGVKLNMDMAEKGLETKSGIGLGAAMNLLMGNGGIQKDVINEARILTSAACDARMAGINMPVMSSAGSGNHGITAIIPVAVVCESMDCGDEKLARALAYSHLITSYIKVFTGRLSPVCGCAVAAGIGASAAITWAMDGSDQQISGAIKNMVGSITGMVCDGAKGGCALKLSTAASEAVIQAKLARMDIVIDDADGIINPNISKTIENLGKFSRLGMESADSEIISIMLDN